MTLFANTSIIAIPFGMEVHTLFSSSTTKPSKQQIPFELSCSKVANGLRGNVSLTSYAVMLVLYLPELLT